MYFYEKGQGQKLVESGVHNLFNVVSEDFLLSISSSSESVMSG